MAHLQTAYEKGAAAAKVDFEKIATGPKLGQLAELLGYTGRSAKVANVRERILAALTSPYGEALVRTPVQASMGALAGLGTGYLVGKPEQGAALGALGGGMGGLAVAGAPKLRRALIRTLAGA